jgi:hypothetical protein
LTTALDEGATGCRFPTPGLSIIRLARDDDILPAFHRRRSFVKAAQARQTVRSAGMIDTTTPE